MIALLLDNILHSPTCWTKIYIDVMTQQLHHVVQTFLYDYRVIHMQSWLVGQSYSMLPRYTVYN